MRPHPHIGLATVTYLFEGEILHRDSLGSVQAIRPGDVNWMTAGRGIVHSERTPPRAARRRHRRPRHPDLGRAAARARGGRAAFAHHPAARACRWSSGRRRDAAGDRRARVRRALAGARCFADTLYVDGRRWTPARSLALAARARGARASTSSRATSAIDGTDARAGQLAGARRRRHGSRCARGSSARVDAARRRAAGRPALHLVELRLELARAHRAGEGTTGARAASAQVPGETERIPLPSR